MYRSLIRSRIAAFCCALGTCATAGANPLGPTVVHGNVGITSPNPSTLQITNSPGSIVNWRSFNIGAGETTRFVQENAASAILNRVTGDQMSELLGNLTSNGRVFLINGNGIIVGEGATIDTAGLVLSTLNITDEDFLAGQFEFAGEDDAGFITNRGYIKTAPGGEVILLAPKITNESVDGVENSGLIETPDGELILAAGHRITITSLDDPDISFDVESIDGEVVNLGQLIAAGGSAEILAGTIRHSGEINADAITVDASGTVRLVAGERIETEEASVITANGAGDGGTVRIEAVAAADDAPASSVVLAGEVSADGAASGGRVEVLGDEVTLGKVAVTANGDSGGGTVRIGGDVQGGDALPTATAVTVSGASVISADATNDGDGGSVAVWSESSTAFYGYASARGGNAGGDGGFVEVSGKQDLVLKGSLDVGALNGSAGELLLDPGDIFIVPGSDTTEVLDPTPSAGDRFGSSFTILPNGNILVRNQDADVGGLVDAGEILLFSPAGDLLGSIEGNAANERLGSLFQTTVTDGNLVFRSPNAGTSMSGAVILFSDDTGMEIGRVSGTSPNEQLGLTVDFFGVPPNTYVIQSPLADVAGKADAGALILVNNMTGLEIGRVSGAAAGDMVGSNSLVLASSGNYFLPVPNADVGGVVDAGSLLLVNGMTGKLIGKVNGNNTSEFLGSSVNYFSFGPDALITSVNHNNGAFTNAGAMIRVADVNLGGGNIERGRVMGGSTNEFLGVDGFQFLSSGDYVVFSESADVGGFTDAGSAILTDGATGNPIGRLDGTSNGEFLGNYRIIESTNGNYWVQSPLADTGGANSGTLYLVDGTTGLALGQFDGDTVSEQFSATTEQNFNVGFDKLIVRAPAHGGNTGLVGLFDSVDLGGGNFLSGSVTGAQNGDLVGNRPLTFLSNGNYLVQAPNYQNGSTPNAGAVIVADNATGNPLLTILGDTSGERLGDFGDVDQFTLGSIDNFLIISPEHGGNSGAVFFVDGSDTASILNTVQGENVNDNLGTQGVEAVAGGILIPVHDADPGMLVDAGTIFLVSDTGALINRQDGQGAGDLFGLYIDLFSLPGAILVNNPNSDAGGTNSGQLVSLDPNTLNINWTIDGTTGEQLGSGGGMQTLFSSGNALIFSPFEDTGGTNAGRVILANLTTGTVIGSLFGQSAGEQLGNSGFALERSNGNYFVASTAASPGAIAGAGSVYLADGATGTLIGQVDGTAAGEGFGSLIDSFTLPGDDILIRSSTHTVGAFTNAGTVVQAAAVDLGGGNIVRGRIDGGANNEFFGSISFTNLFNNNLVFRSPNAAPGGLAGAGSVFVYDTTTATVLNRIDGAVAGDMVGSNGLFTTSNQNFFLPVPNADVGAATNAGKLMLVNGNTGSVIGSLNGNAANEFLGSSTSFLSSSDLLVRAPAHNVGGLAGAGAIFRVTNTNLGGGTFTVGRVAGKSAGEGLGGLFPTFFTDTASIVSPNADPGGIMDAGSVVFFNRNTFAEIGRVNGRSANENFTTVFPSFISTDLRLYRSPGADVGGLVDAGTVVLVNVATGKEVGRTNGISSGEFFGNLSPQFVTGGFIIRSPDADVGGLVDAGRVVQISSLTGLEVQTISGISANERLGAFFPQYLSDGRLLFASPDADVGGFIDSGRFAFLDPTVIVSDPAATFSFSNQPGTDFFVTNGTLLNLLASGAAITLQANNDITTLAGANLVAGAGSLTLQAGRSINLNALLSVPTLNLIANESAENGVDTAFRGPGTGDVIIHGATVSADTMTVRAENVLVHATNDPGAWEPMPAVLFGNSLLDIEASNVEIQGGYGVDAFAAVVSLGTLDILADTVQVFGGDGDALGILPLDSDVFSDFTGLPNGLPPFAAAFAFNELNIETSALVLEGGTGDQAFAALVSNGLFNVTASQAELIAGEGTNADAVFLALGGIADIAVDNCTDCEQLFFDPLLDPAAQTGVYIAGLLQDPSTDAILALLDKDDEDSGDDDDDDEDEEDAGECQ